MGPHGVISKGDVGGEIDQPKGPYIRRRVDIAGVERDYMRVTRRESKISMFTLYIFAILMSHASSIDLSRDI
jgi:hypothetical protein